MYWHQSYLFLYYKLKSISSKVQQSQTQFFHFYLFLKIAQTKFSHLGTGFVYCAKPHLTAVTDLDEGPMQLQDPTLLWPFKAL